MDKRKLSFRFKTFLANSVYWLFFLFGQNKKTLSVLCYHSISNAPDRYSISLSSFESQIEKIAKYAKFISLDDALEVDGKKRIIGPAVVLTVDDGYTDVVKIEPIIRKYKIPVTLFVLSDPRDANRKELDNYQKLLTFGQIRELSKKGFSIGCHSATHSDFYKLSKNQIGREIIESKKTLEKKLGLKINYFAYPKGRFNKTVLGAVRKAGYKAAFAVFPGCIEKKSDRRILPRTIIDKTHSLADFPAVFSSSNFFLRKLTDRFHIWERMFLT